MAATIDTSWKPLAVPDFGGSSFLQYSTGLRASANDLMQGVVSQHQKEQEMAQAALQNKLANDLAVATLEENKKQNQLGNLFNLAKLQIEEQNNKEKLAIERQKLAAELQKIAISRKNNASNGSTGTDYNPFSPQIMKMYSDNADRGRKFLSQATYIMPDNMPDAQRAAVGNLSLDPTKEILGVPVSTALNILFSTGVDVSRALFSVNKNFGESEPDYIDRLYRKITALAETKGLDRKAYDDSVKSAQLAIQMYEAKLEELAKYRADLYEELRQQQAGSNNDNASKQPTAKEQKSSQNKNSDNVIDTALGTKQ